MRPKHHNDYAHGKSGWVGGNPRYGRVRGNNTEYRPRRTRKHQNQLAREEMREQTFKQWKAEVDEEIAAQCGMISDDLPDVDYRGLYETGNTPAEAADYAIEYANEN
jgi:hypothetical protein